MPERIQLRRTKGYRKPEGAVVVSRPTRWGNPFVSTDPARAVDLYRRWLTTGNCDVMIGGDTGLSLAYLPSWNHADTLRMRLREELRGRDLACWCRLDRPCHADVLLELANGEPLDLLVRIRAEVPDGLG